MTAEPIGAISAFMSKMNPKGGRDKREELKKIKENFSYNLVFMERESLQAEAEVLRDQNTEAKQRLNASERTIRDLEEQIALLQHKYRSENLELQNEIQDLKTKVNTEAFKGKHQNDNEYIEADFYAGVIEIPTIKSLETGWNISIKKWAEYQELAKKMGTIVSVIGNYSKGKTFLLELLTGNEMPHGFNVNTQGISIAYLKDEISKKQKPIVCLDTKGGGNPLAIHSNDEEDLLELLRDHEATEDILQNFILEQADVILVVVSDLTFDDQKLVKKIIKKFKNNAKKKIIIVHNLFHSHFIRDVQYKIESSILPSFNVKETEFKDVGEGQNAKYYVEIAQEKIPHLVLAKQHTEAGNYFNGTTLEFIKDNIRADIGINTVDVVQTFHKYLQDHLRSYADIVVPNKKNAIAIPQEEELAMNVHLVLDEDQKPIKLKLENDGVLKMKTVYSDLFGDLKIFKHGEFRPDFILCEEGSPNDETRFLCLRIECSGGCTDVESNIELDGKDYLIHVNGKKNVDRDFTQAIECHREQGQFSVETGRIEMLTYPINIHEDPIEEYKDGVYFLRWPLVKIKRRGKKLI